MFFSIPPGGTSHRQRHPRREKARAQVGEIKHHDVRFDRVREDAHRAGMATAD